jgi:hypothetical protein
MEYKNRAYGSFSAVRYNSFERDDPVVLDKE